MLICASACAAHTFRWCTASPLPNSQFVLFFFFCVPALCIPLFVFLAGGIVHSFVCSFSGDDFFIPEKGVYHKKLNVVGDKCAWVCYRVHIFTRNRQIGVIGCRRKFLPPFLDTFHDMLFVLYGPRSEVRACSRSRLPRLPFFPSGGPKDNTRGAGTCCQAGKQAGRRGGWEIICGVLRRRANSYTVPICLLPLCSSLCMCRTFRAQAVRPDSNFMTVLEEIVDSLSPAVAPLPYKEAMKMNKKWADAFEDRSK